MKLFEMLSPERSLYVNRKVKNADDIHEWAKKEGFTSALKAEDLHVTIVYSKEPVVWSLEPKTNDIIVPSSGRSVKEFDNNAVVLAIECPELTDRWQQFKNIGCSSSYPNYSAHITITYEGAPEDVSKVKPYTGKIVLGPEIYAEINDDWKTERTEQKLDESMTLSDIGPAHAYDVFKTSYEKETGRAWDMNKFMSRARDWEFYGDENGYVTIRRQRSGLIKLTGVAGDPRSILKGVSELVNEGGPIWGAVSEPLMRIAVKRGLIAPHKIIGGKLFLKALMNFVPTEVFGTTNRPVVTDTGAIRIEYGDVGSVEKYLVGSKEYFAYLVKMPDAKKYLENVPGLGRFLTFLGVIKNEMDESFGYDQPRPAFGKKGLEPGQKAPPIEPIKRIAPPTDPEERELLSFAQRYTDAETFASRMNSVVRRNADPQHIHDAHDREHKKLVALWNKWKAGGLIHGETKEVDSWSSWNRYHPSNYR